MNAAFVTGSTGFIGRNLVERLTASGRKVYAFTRGPRGDIPAGAVEVRGDILAPETYIDALRECSTLYHCAARITFRAEDFAEAFAVNVEGTRAVFKAASLAGTRRAVLLGACAVFGTSASPTRLLNETAAPLISRGNVYAFTKKAAEQAALEAGGAALETVIANISTVYGRGDSNMNSGSVIRSVRNGMRFVPPGGTSYIAMDDLLDGLELLEQRGRAGERYILSAENLTYADLVRRIAAILGLVRRPIRLPRALRLPMLLAVAGVARLSRGRPGLSLVTPQIIGESFGYKYFDGAKARRELDFNPRRSLEQAVGEAIVYYQAKGLL